MNNQEILDNAPKNWTHYATSSNKYFMIEGWRMHVWLGEVWSVPISNGLDVLMVGDVRSLADIKRIVEQDKKIAELEKDAFVKSNEANAATHRAIEMLLEKDKRITELELWIECAIRPDLKIPEWIRVSASGLLRSNGV